MLATNSMQFLKFKPIGDLSTYELGEKIFIETNDADEDKLILNEVDERGLDGYYITYFNVKELIFNPETNSLETTLLKKSTVIPFFIDIVDEILYVWGNKSNINKLNTRLNILLDNNVIIEPYNIDFGKVVDRLNCKNIKIVKVKIDDYILEENIIAMCALDLMHHSNPLHIAKKYVKNLTQLTIMISTNNEQWLTMVLYKSGSIIMYKSREEITFETLEIIRKICVN